MWHKVADMRERLGKEREAVEGHKKALESERGLTKALSLNELGGRLQRMGRMEVREREVEMALTE